MWIIAKCGTAIVSASHCSFTFDDDSIHESVRACCQNEAQFAELKSKAEQLQGLSGLDIRELPLHVLLCIHLGFVFLAEMRPANSC